MSADTGFLEHLTPFDHFRFQLRCKLFRRAALNLEASAEKPLFDFSRVKGLNGLSVEAVDDV